jgi:hypothetical protein
LGHRVVAVEPTVEMRLGAMALHPSPLIEWLKIHCRIWRGCGHAGNNLMLSC